MILDLNGKDNTAESVNHNYIFRLYCTELFIYVFQRYFKVFKVYLL